LFEAKSDMPKRKGRDTPLFREGLERGGGGDLSL